MSRTLLRPSSVQIEAIASFVVHKHLFWSTFNRFTSVSYQPGSFFNGRLPLLFVLNISLAASSSLL